MRKALARWECCRCGEVHDYDDDARECCPTRIREVFECPACSHVHHDEDSALECCPEEAEAESAPVSTVELEAQGQMRLELTS